MKKAKRFSAAFLAIVLVLSMVVFAPAAVRAEGQYTVSFDSKGGSEVKSITADAGQLIQKPENPTKEEYTFAGWYTDSKYKDRWDFEEDVMPDGNLTLIAKWVTGEEAAALADEYAEEGSGNGEDPVWDETYVPETDPYIPDQDVYDVTETDP
ncbi:MAG: InlB B-repeat-containing protein, partial [Eubacterium sp.]|nr:InlB B-repeat-containing protein [Eubacterium sp.]